MTKTKESFEKDVTDFSDYFNRFELIIYKEKPNINSSYIIQLFKIFMDHHTYEEIDD